jgi:hypothetical protein
VLIVNLIGGYYEQSRKAGMRTAQYPLGYGKINKKPDAQMHGTEQKGRTRSEVKMNYFQLIEYMKMYRKDMIQKSELIFAIYLWQESIKDYK